MGLQTVMGFSILQNSFDPAHYAWFMLVIYVVVMDTLLIYHEKKGKPNYYTMSTAFEDSLDHPLWFWILTLGWAGLTVHLFDKYIPKRKHGTSIKACK